MKKFFGMLLLCSCLVSSVFAMEFSDVSGHWAFEYIDRMVVNNVVSGYPDGTFRPNSFVKVNEFLKILVEASGYKKVMVGECWPDWYINSAIEYGFIFENEFDCYDIEISRYEAAMIVARFIDVSDISVAKNIFTDLDKEYRRDVLKLVSLGVINGYSDNTFRGEQGITRAEALKVVSAAIRVRKICVLNRQYDLDEYKNLSNYLGRDLSGTYFKNHYFVDRGKLYIYDDGRYAVLKKYFPNEKNVKNSVLLKLMKAIVLDDNFVGLSYIPEHDLGISSIVISSNTRESYLYNGSYNFSFKFFEDELYELGRISMVDEFSNECFMKISVLGLWDDLYDYKNGLYIDEFYAEQFRRGIVAVLGDDDGESFFEYAIEKIRQSNEKEYGTQIVEVATIGDYTVNVYSFGSVGVDFYFCK